MTLEAGFWDTLYYDFEVPPEVQVLYDDHILIMVGKEINGAFIVPYNNEIRYVRSKSNLDLAFVPGVWNNFPVRADLFPDYGMYVYTAMNMRTGIEWEILRIDQRTSILTPPNPPIMENK